MVTPGWAARLTGFFAEPRMAVVAPRVASRAGRRILDAYEMRHSPLDLGPAPAVVGPRRRVAYVPSAAMVVRRRALLEVGGFDEELRYGEDVDIVHRLIAAGWKVRYAPEAVVHHRPRETVAAFCRQRSAYGGSAVTLERRHPRTIAPLRIHPETADLWAAALTLGPGGAAVRLARCWRPRLAGASAAATSARCCARYALRGHGQATLSLGRALTREWAPLTVLLAASSRRGRRIATAALGVELASAWPRSAGLRGAVGHLALRRARRRRVLARACGRRRWRRAAPRRCCRG